MQLGAADYAEKPADEAARLVETRDEACLIRLL